VSFFSRLEEKHLRKEGRIKRSKTSSKVVIMTKQRKETREYRTPRNGNNIARWYENDSFSTSISFSWFLSTHCCYSWCVSLFPY
jgi:hypothetical protein